MLRWVFRKRGAHLFLSICVILRSDIAKPLDSAAQLIVSSASATTQTSKRLFLLRVVTICTPSEAPRWQDIPVYIRDLDVAWPCGCHCLWPYSSKRAFHV
ncbi:hypothetical protein LX32DRAFT_44570 [Colletotrichum zoysiae]|uniref:Secreted protein n=1 Tax=Colletotrichum zoysiae TaxID=1216348 RepID=A0AAD9LYR1_9PEZI|nr:hypothetical protein LX32DRAFT_44570 [Colletotrichum zoysiae]